MSDHRCDLPSAIADWCELDGEMVSEVLMIVSTVGEDGSAGSYRIATWPPRMPQHSRLGLMRVMDDAVEESSQIGERDE